MGQTILLVDDESNILQALARTLRNQPYQVLTTRSAEEAIVVLKSHPIDLIVSDEKMPGIQGSELTEWVARQYPDIIRIILTGQPDVPAMMKAINNGKIFRYLTKPCKEAEFAIAIREGLELREKRQSALATSLS